MNKRVMLEASGSLVSAWMIKAVKENGDIAVASDICENCAGKYLADDFILVPSSCDCKMWDKMEKMLLQKQIDIVIPSLDETLVEWAEKQPYLEAQYGIKVMISPKETIEIFQDKYKTYQFFEQHRIPTPKVSLEFIYPVLKPRRGRGSKGVKINPPEGSFSMDGMISQELVHGDEYTIDCLFDHEGHPVYIVPRKRVLVKDGKAVNGVVVFHEEVTRLVKKIASAAKFCGPVNMQCFDTDNGVKFIEINPRIGGGMALGFAATENWIKLITDFILEGREITAKKPIKYGLRMFRYYEEIFVY